MIREDYIWVMHKYKKILVTDDPMPPVAVCTMPEERKAGIEPSSKGFFAGSYADINDRIAKVSELEAAYPDYITDYSSVWW